MKGRAIDAKSFVIAVLLPTQLSSLPPETDSAAREKYAQSSRFRDGSGGDGDGAACGGRDRYVVATRVEKLSKVIIKLGRAVVIVEE